MSWILLPFKFLFAVFVLSIPVLGVWAASSLAAFLGGPTWLAVAVGSVLFPLGPLVWDAWARARARRKDKQRRPFLTAFDRILLRTLFLNIAFVAGLLALRPTTLFEALAARGDWPLDGRSGPAVDLARSVVFKAADRVEWLYDLTHANRYAEPVEEPNQPDSSEESGDSGVSARDAGRPPDDVGSGSPSTDAGFDLPDAGSEDAAGEHVQVDAGENGEISIQVIGQPEPPEEPEPVRVEEPRALWPTPDEPHPLARNVPAEASSSVDRLAEYFQSREPDPALRVRLIHDFVALHVIYDHASLARGEYPRQDADTVLSRKTAVCAGYSQLFLALARGSGLQAQYIVGRVRDEDTLEIAGTSHAWNAVKLNDEWHLVDVTWDSPGSNVESKQGKYRTAYLLTPPEVFGLDHFPDEERWQLRPHPISRGEFIRQPMMTADFYRQGLRLVDPQRSAVDAAGQMEITIENPRNRFMSAVMVQSGRDRNKDADRRDCAPSRYVTSNVRIQCDFPEPGVFDVLLFAGPAETGVHDYVGSVQVNNRPG